MTFRIVMIPIKNLPYYEHEVKLQDNTFILTFRWNDRESCFYLDLKFFQGQPILTGIKVVADFGILKNTDLTDYGLSGYFLLTPLSSSGSDIPKMNTIRTLVDNFMFFYVLEE